ETWMVHICGIQVSAPFISINSISTIAVEYIPIAIVLMLFMEMNGAETWMVHICGIQVSAPFISINNISTI
ncbi:hypothetical protein PS005_24935, partial [Shigella sonnei]|nr:hypothetical protein [Shigella sonnei]